MTDISVGDRVEAGWYASASEVSDGHYRGPKGTVIAITAGTHSGTHVGFCWYWVRWDNGYEAEFTRSEIRLGQPARRLKTAPESAIDETAVDAPLDAVK